MWTRFWPLALVFIHHSTIQMVCTWKYSTKHVYHNSCSNVGQRKDCRWKYSTKHSYHRSCSNVGQRKDCLLFSKCWQYEYCRCQQRDTTGSVLYVFRSWPTYLHVNISLFTNSLWWYGSWLYNCLCNQCLSTLKLLVRIQLMAKCTQCNILR